MTWLTQFAEAAAGTDRLSNGSDHIALLAVGLVGEAGSVLAELKKEARERDAYPAYRHKMREEFGDFLWYFVRLASVVDQKLIDELEALSLNKRDLTDVPPSAVFLELGAAVGDISRVISTGRCSNRTEKLRALLYQAWAVLLAVSQKANVSLQEAAESNTRKIMSRWPSEKTYTELFDSGFPEEEQLPRRLEIEFRERSHGEDKVVVLRCNGINFGDRLTDNIQDPDGYRYHDIFHLAHAVHLGWSPVIRSLLRCKRKSSTRIDEGEDGARAVILEEAVAAVVFSRSKRLNFFDCIRHVDYDLLKIVREIVQGYEVEVVPLWQWEAAILDGYAAFRKLRTNCGGRVTLDLTRRQLICLSPVGSTGG